MPSRQNESFMHSNRAALKHFNSLSHSNEVANEAVGVVGAMRLALQMRRGAIAIAKVCSR